MPYGPFFGRYTFANYMSLGRYPSNNITNTFTVHPTMTYIKGSRTIKFGVDMRRTQYSTQTYGNVFVLGATNTFSQRDYLRADASSGNSIASWLLGTPSSGSINYNVFPIFSFPYIAPWVQSDWKISRKLTVNVGLRQDYNVPPSERFDRLNRGFDTEVKSPLSAMIDRERFPDFPEIRGGWHLPGSGQRRDGRRTLIGGRFSRGPDLRGRSRTRRCCAADGAGFIPTPITTTCRQPDSA